VTELESITQSLEAKNAGERIAYLYDTFGDRVVASTSFGLQAAVMLHLIAKHAPKIPVVFVDTGYLFAETYQYIESLKKQLDVDLRTYHPAISAAEIGGDIWLSGLRRSQSSSRADREFAESQAKQTKVYPILDWADAQVSSYFSKNKLPKHPLESKGYVTMGDWHSTIPLEEGMTAEETRFNGQKYECGLHVNNFQI